VRCALTISTNDLDLPLELLDRGARSFLSLECPISRMPLGTSTDRGYRTQRQSTRKPNVRFLLIGASSPDLPNVRSEIEKLKTQLKRAFRETVVVDDPPATYRELCKAITSGDYHVIHFAGHAEYHSRDPAQSKLILDDGDSLSAEEIEQMLHGCKTTANERKELNSIAPAEGLAAAFIYGGALGCIGNTWSVHDKHAADFAASFYEHFIAGHTLGKAMLLARQAMSGQNRLTWAGFVLFGNPLFRMNWNPEQRFSP
jgi:CHAT domain-containing protein